ncbi:hypothetical protein [Marinomonas mediterranea]|uniref:Uncharacterized protein n=1 Tax=Marinomonas mediterranea (strain ATCC 700492 / JCM 21426 / NBRC 103028 / MMB-1) TaxID=717774 RepID=F2JYA1_MARM1|nr:hypothetical protein [Marinomonas mediterranea]ADZ91932.1 hypothetical protein Marme_2701 [Marinomonas mediterranea MMB-1]WCN09884.1 hypothetical protein GV055_13645 [Marinomonas mediterranea]WCN13965.1 hypothetical protein GV054_13635 [Marinomonas mediterranea]WCN18016.1 hypothetical protein GV053_13660 [Marinomonas mediterranea MMB-1]
MSSDRNEVTAKLEKIRTSWLPALTKLFGEPAMESEFVGFVVDDVPAPSALYEDASKPYTFKIRIPEKSLDNDVMLLADVVHESCLGLYPCGWNVVSAGKKETVLSKGVAVYASLVALRFVFGDDCVADYLTALDEKAPENLEAFEAIELLLEKDAQAIIKLRNVQPFLNKVTADDCRTAGIALDESELNRLLTPYTI